MTVSRLWIWLSVLAGALMALASAAGIFIPGTYAKETVSWAAQGAGQDVVNLLVTVPTLFFSAYAMHRKSLRAFLLWLGAQIYVIYSYVIYAFFIHFGPWFLVYVAILGLSFYSVLGSLIELNWNVLAPRFAGVQVKSVSAFLMLIAVMFYLLWTSEVVKALLANSLPQGLSDIGLPVNPIHVLDMAFVLPAIAIVSRKLWQRKTLAFIFAVPLLVFIAFMGIAIISMMLFLAAKGSSTPLAVEIAMGLAAFMAILLSARFLKKIQNI